MSTTRLFIGAAAISLVSPCWSQPATASPPGDLLAEAIQNSRELLAIRQRVDEARGLLRQAGVRPAFTLEATGVTGKPLGTQGEEQYGAGVSRTLETGGKRSLRMQVAENQLALAEIEYDERLRQLRYEIRALYAGFAGEAERVRTLDRVAESYRESLALMKARVEQGDAAALERDLLAVELSRTAALREAVAGRLESARTDLARLAGLPGSKAVANPPMVPLPRTAYDLEQLAKAALAKRPDLRASNVSGRQGEAEVALAKAQGRADVTLSAGYSRVYSRFDNQYGLTSSGMPTQLHDRDDILSVGVSLPLFGKNRNQGNIEAASARYRALQYRREFLEQSIPLEVEAAWKRLSSAQQSYQTLEQTVIQQSEKNLQVILRAYQLGQLRLLDVLNEQRRLLDTRLASIDAKVDVLRAIAELERAIGGELQ